MNIGYIKQERLPFTSIDKVKYFLEMITVHRFEQGYVFRVPVFDEDSKMEKIVQRLLKKLKKMGIDTLVFSNQMIHNHFYFEMEQRLKEEKYNILDGRKLMSYMDYEIFQYILNLQKADMKQEDIFFMIKKDKHLDLQFLSRFIENCKTVNIVTNDMDRFKKIQERLYKQESILIGVSNNKSKSLKRAKYIFNINMSKKEIEKFKINRNAIIVNFNENIKYNDKTFDGININYFQIDLPDEQIEQFDEISSLEEFDRVKLYERILTQKMEDKKKIEFNKEELSTMEIITDIIAKDNIHIRYLIGNNGKIDEKEIIQNYQKVI